MVSLDPITQSLLTRLRVYLTNLYGERLHQTMLFGSYARGEARPDSDIDILVVLKGTVNPGREVAKVSDFVADLSLEHDKVISCFFMDEERFSNRQGPLLRNIRREGIPV
jgi:predicted nucleotidyltransferase